jgi:hypothetical protein
MKVPKDKKGKRVAGKRVAGTAGGGADRVSRDMTVPKDKKGKRVAGTAGGGADRVSRDIGYRRLRFRGDAIGSQE